MVRGLKGQGIRRNRVSWAMPIPDPIFGEKQEFWGKTLGDLGVEYGDLKGIKEGCGCRT